MLDEASDMEDGLNSISELFLAYINSPQSLLDRTLKSTLSTALNDHNLALNDYNLAPHVLGILRSRLLLYFPFAEIAPGIDDKLVLQMFMPFLWATNADDFNATTSQKFCKVLRPFADPTHLNDNPNYDRDLMFVVLKAVTSEQFSNELKGGLDEYTNDMYSGRIGISLKALLDQYLKDTMRIMQNRIGLPHTSTIVTLQIYIANGRKNLREQISQIVRFENLQRIIALEARFASLNKSPRQTAAPGQDDAPPQYLPGWPCYTYNASAPNPQGN